MPLDFAEFAHHYEGTSASEAQRRAHFETFACIMECVVRYFWQDRPSENALGISIDHATLALLNGVESDHPLTIIFNGAASHDAAGKKES